MNSKARPATQALHNYIHSFDQQKHAGIHQNASQSELFNNRKRKSSQTFVNIPVSKTAAMMKNFISDSEDDELELGNNTLPVEHKGSVKPYRSIKQESKDIVDTDDSSSNEELLPSKLSNRRSMPSKPSVSDPEMNSADYVPSENSNRKSLLLSLSKEITSQLESEEDKPSKAKRRKPRTPSSSEDESVYNPYNIPVMSPPRYSKRSHRNQSARQNTLPKRAVLNPAVWDSDSESDVDILASVVKQNLNMSALKQSRLEPETIKVDKPSKIVIYNSFYSDKDKSRVEESKDNFKESTKVDAMADSIRSQTPLMSTSSSQTIPDGAQQPEPSRLMQQPPEPVLPQPSPHPQPTLPHSAVHPQNYFPYSTATWAPSQAFPQPAQYAAPHHQMYSTQPSFFQPPIQAARNVWDTYLRANSYAPSIPYSIPTHSAPVPNNPLGGGQYPSSSYQRASTPKAETPSRQFVGTGRSSSTPGKQFKISLLPPVSLEAPPAAARPPIRLPTEPAKPDPHAKLLHSYDELSTAVKNINEILNTIKTNIQIKQQHYKMGLCTEEQYIKYLKAQSQEYQRVKEAQGHKIAEYTKLMNKQS